MFHFWNSVADIARPWVSSFEHTIPLGDAAGRDRTAFGMQLAQRDECRRLIAFSESARRDAIAEWQRLLPSNQMDRLIAKTDILLPPQAIISADSPAIAQQPTTFAFVGKEFYCKGGLQILKAFRALLEAGKRDWTPW